jgi:hypothetical protein
MIPFSTIWSVVFIEAARLEKAMIAYERALEWQELFDLAVREGMSEADIVDMGYRVAGVLSSMNGSDNIFDYSSRGFVLQEEIHGSGSSFAGLL